MLTELTKDGAVQEEDFEVGMSYSYFIKNMSDKPGEFALSDYVSAYGGVQFVCQPNGEMPAVLDIPEDQWLHGIMGEIEKARYVIEEGYYLIQIHTPDGFDMLLNGNQTFDPLIVVSQVEKLEALEVFDSMNMQVKVLHKFKASQLTFMGQLTKPVMYALERVS
jgi:hypothetical protein